jgi:predicted AlkP superfamily pyrophosphatase or phosphodiesterase
MSVRTVLFVATAMLCIEAPVQPLGTQAVGARDRHVVLISIDGFAAFHLDNAGIDLPNIRELAAAGARAAAAESVFPSMTHPAHTTLVTGVTPRLHGVINNRVTDRRSGQRFHITNVPRSESVRVPTLFDRVHASGRRTAALFWPETRDDDAIDDNITEVFDEREMADPAAVRPALLAELRAAGVPIDSFYAFYDNPFTQGAADQALTRAAVHLLKTRRPALLALHLLAADKAQHEVGPDHYLARAALSTADDCVGMLRKAVEDAGLGERVTFVIAADHGFVTVRDEVNLAPALADRELDRVMTWRADGWYIWGERGPGFDPARHSAALERVLERVASVPGVTRVVRPGEFHALGYPEYDENAYVPGQVLIAGRVDTHLVIDKAETDTSRRLKARPYHGHGYFPDHPAMDAVLVFSGAGIAPGARLGRVNNADVAPTLAALLGVDLPTATGRVLAGVLK